MPCSRTEAPLAQCAPRLSGEANTGSCRIHTPFCTTASIEQPTEQCVHTVRFTSICPLVSSSFASALPIIEKGSCAATAPAPTLTPERFRNVRRSMVVASIPEGFREARHRFVERGVLALLYCGAQRFHNGINPAPEEAPLLLERARVSGDEVAHRVAERRYMVFRLRRLCAPREPKRGELAAKLGERRLVGIADGIGARIKCDRRAARADERRVELFAQRFGLRRRGRLAERAPCRGERLVLGLDLPSARQRLEKPAVGRPVQKPCEQAIEIRPCLLLGRQRRRELQWHRVAHFGRSTMVASVLFSIMSITRQSPHICRRLSDPAPANIEWPPSRPSMASIILRVPKGLPQRTQLKGSASFSTTASLALAPTRSRGTRVMASSGQVLAQRPHCTQFASMKRRRGASAESRSAACGQAPMHALQSVQLSWFTLIAPNGAPAAREI